MIIDQGLNIYYRKYWVELNTRVNKKCSIFYNLLFIYNQKTGTKSKKTGKIR